MGKYTHLLTEVAYGQDKKSRVDFLLYESQENKNTVPSSGSLARKRELLLEQSIPRIYLEVKNTTLAQGRIALFPDTETTRGQKHLRELMALLPQHRAVMLYFINRGDCTAFAPGDATDPIYGKLLRDAINVGLEILPCRFETTPEGVRYLGFAECKF